MKNIDNYAKQLGKNTHIRIDADILRRLNHGRYDASHVLRDQFYNYNYILNRGRRVNVNYVEVVGRGEDRRLIFNGSKYISRIFEYYGLEYHRNNSVEHNAILFEEVFYNVQNASCVQDFFDISDKLGQAFVSSVISEIPNGPFNERKAKYYVANFLNYIKKGEEPEEEVLDAIDFVLPKFINRELSRLDQLAIDIYDGFKNLERVPNSFVSNITESDFDLLVSFIILSDYDLCYRYDLEKYVTRFIEKEGYKAIQDYKINFVYNDKDIELSFQDLIDKFVSVYKKKVNIESPVIEVKEDEIEIPKLDENYLKEQLLKNEVVVNLPTPMFSEISDEEFVRDVVSHHIPKKDRNVDEVKLFKDKVKLYQLLDKKSILVGSESFNGYFGFEMENGMIILDKFFSNVSKKEISISDAWYAVHSSDFEEFLGLSKMDSVRAFRDGRLYGFRGYHTRGWQDDVMNVASMDVELSNGVKKGR